MQHSPLSTFVTRPLTLSLDTPPRVAIYVQFMHLVRLRAFIARPPRSLYRLLSIRSAGVNSLGTTGGKSDNEGTPDEDWSAHCVYTRVHRPVGRAKLANVRTSCEWRDGIVTFAWENRIIRNNFSRILQMTVKNRFSCLDAVTLLLKNYTARALARRLISNSHKVYI